MVNAERRASNLELRTSKSRAKPPPGESRKQKAEIEAGNRAKAGKATQSRVNTPGGECRKTGQATPKPH